MIISVRTRGLVFWRGGLKEFNRAFGRWALTFLCLANPRSSILWRQILNLSITLKGKGITLNLAKLWEGQLLRFKRLGDGCDCPEAACLVHTRAILSQLRHRVYIPKVWVREVVGGLHIKSLQVFAAYLRVIEYVRCQLHLFKGDTLSLVTLHRGQGSTYLVSSTDCDGACNVFQMERCCLAIHRCMASLLLFRSGKPAVPCVTAQDVLNGCSTRVGLIRVCCHHMIQDCSLGLQMSSINIVLLTHTLIMIVRQYDHVLREHPSWPLLTLGIEGSYGSWIETFIFL